MADDPARQRVLMFGGNTYGTLNGETWQWDGASWTLSPVPGPTPRHAHSMTYDAARDIIVLYGGSTRSDGGETWLWHPPAPCPADLDADRQVGFGDVLIVLAAWNRSPSGDVTGEGITNVDDLLTVLAAFGPCR
jgi:hypothetical protein